MSFIDNGDGTVTDTSTSLMWEKGPGVQMTWQAAVDRCAALTLAGHADWRLPSRGELVSIVDYTLSEPACDPVFGATADAYWSASAYTYYQSNVWVVNFCDGYVYSLGKADSHVRAVRTILRTPATTFTDEDYVHLAECAKDPSTMFALHRAVLHLLERVTALEAARRPPLHREAAATFTADEHAAERRSALNKLKWWELPKLKVEDVPAATESARVANDGTADEHAAEIEADRYASYEARAEIARLKDLLIDTLEERNEWKERAIRAGWKP